MNQAYESFVDRVERLVGVELDGSVDTMLSRADVSKTAWMTWKRNKTHPPDDVVQRIAVVVSLPSAFLAARVPDQVLDNLERFFRWLIHDLNLDRVRARDLFQRYSNDITNQTRVEFRGVNAMDMRDFEDLLKGENLAPLQDTDEDEWEDRELN